MSKARTYLALAALLIASAAQASAQVTTFMPPPDRARDSVTAVTAVADSVARDSVAAAQVANMKAWVDSAAGDIVTTRSDSMGMTADGMAQSFQNGSRAPETATPLPLIALLGAGAMGAGFILRRARS